MSGRLKILCLHGFTSNGTVHAHQLRRITSQLPEYEFLFPDGPHEVDLPSQLDMTQSTNQSWAEMVTSLSTAGHRAWWYARDSDPKDPEKPGGFYGLERSLSFLSAYIAAQDAPIHAIWGFSQGACLAGMLTALFQESRKTQPLRQEFFAGIKEPAFGVIFSGFKARFPQYDEIYTASPAGIRVPILHVLGEKDFLVSGERSEQLIEVCTRAAVLRHAGGHDIPKGEADVRRIVEFARAAGGSIDGDGGERSVRGGGGGVQASM